MGADDAVTAAQRQKHAMILSQGATEPVRQRIEQSRSAIEAAVAHFPERFGSKLIPVVQRVLSGESVAGPLFVQPVLLTRANVRQYPKLAALV
jgi:hypothetical protein